MVHPYVVPNLSAVRNDQFQRREAARQAVKGPAISLICVASLGLSAALVFLALEMILLAIGAAANLKDSEPALILLIVKVVLSLAAIAVSGFIIWAGMLMLGLRQHQLCWLAGVLACIPAVSPCIFLGLPFGIWAVTVLNRSEVADAFDP